MRRPLTYKPSWLKPIPKKVDPFYQTPRWRQVSKEVLEAARYLCVTPGCIRKAKMADHIIPRKQVKDPFDKRNLQAMCWNCHSAKTASRDGGLGNPKQPSPQTQTQAQVERGAQPTAAQDWVGIA